MTDREKAAWAVLAIGLGGLLLSQKERVVAGVKKVGKAGDFVIKAIGHAKAVSQEYNLPIWLILTQAAHESAFGLSGLTLKANNLFGFTGEGWKKEGKPVVEMPTTEWKDGKPYKTTRPFRAYPTWADSMRDYARLLTVQPRYKAVVEAARKGDIVGAFQALGRSGYATDPSYGEKLSGVYSGLKSYIV